ncbi:MAG: glutamyl-Q tRNA(Asp) synthetase [Alteromonadaceae bacterium]|jgi:glutamyl-Q tRNA(Asp) synthetase
MSIVSTLIQRPLTSYRGRFAPSPSGLLHFGSLVTALASYLDAKHQNGTWLVRIEDIDPPREQQGATSHILKTLEAYGMFWDEDVLYQSQQTALYHDVLYHLAEQKLSYRCNCTRADIKALGGVYQAHCKNLAVADKHSSVRLINTIATHQYTDLIQGNVSCHQAQAAEDFIIYRKDGLFAYQLAVVVDDIHQGISHIIRGCDLLEPTARQLSFFKIIKAQSPHYGHVPLVVTHEGYKLSKQNKAPAINIKKPQPSLIQALDFLGQDPPQELLSYPLEEIMQWAITHWSIDKIAKKTQIVIKQP